MQYLRFSLKMNYCAPIVRAVQRHFHGQWPKPIKGTIGGWVLVNTNYPVVTNIQLKEKTSHCNNFRIYCSCFDKSGLSLSESASMEVGESGVS